MIVPYLYFNGNAREAITFYAQAFRVEMPDIKRLGDMPPDPAFPMPDAAKDMVMHAELHIADGVVMFSDSFGKPVGMDGNICMMLTLKDGDALRRYWNALKDGAEVTMDLAPAFWTPLYGMLTDKFGIEWQMSQE